MKIPGLDALLYRTVRFLHQAGKIQTVRDLGSARLDEVRSILITVTTALGDSITFTPALTAMRDRFPRTRIVGLYHHAFSSLYEGDPRMDRIIPYYGKYKRLRATLRALREESCELALLPYMNDPDIIPMVLWGGSRILFRMPGRNTIYSFLVAQKELLRPTPPPDHSNLRATDMVKHLGCAIGSQRTSLHIPGESAARVDEILKPCKVAHESAPLIGFHPGASVQWKCWPPESYVELAGRLLSRLNGAQIALTGSLAEHSLCERIRKAGESGRIINLAGKIPIRDMPNFLGRLAVFVSGDTGVAVMAYAVGCRTVTLFWKTNPSISGPMEVGDRHRVIRAESREAVRPDRVLIESIDQIETSRKESNVRNIR